MSKSLSFCLLIAWCCAGDVRAQDLYLGAVMVSDQNTEERAQAVPSALIQVLQKLSGRRELPIGPALDSALLSANRIMVSFHYQDRERAAPDGSVSEEQWLVARFLPAAVDRIIRDLDLPRWRQERQPVTIWVVVDDGLGRRLMPVEYGYAWDAMENIAALRGLPIAWPDLEEGQAGEPGKEPEEEPQRDLQQLQDSGFEVERDEVQEQALQQVQESATEDGPAETPDERVDLQLLWGGFTEHLLEAGDGTGGVLIVAARREGADWAIRWNFSDGKETAGWRSRDRDLSFALAGGVHRLADLVASRNSIASSGQGAWQFAMNVGGISGAGDYARCLGYLQGLSLVSRVDVEEAGPGHVRFVLELNAMPVYLVETLSRDRVLEPGNAENEYLLLP
jgi:hypothetical protein